MFVAFSTAVKASYMRVPLPGNGAEPSVTRTTEVPFRVCYQKQTDRIAFHSSSTIFPTNEQEICQSIQ